RENYESGQHAYCPFSHKIAIEKSPYNQRKRYADIADPIFERIARPRVKPRDQAYHKSDGRQNQASFNAFSLEYAMNIHISLIDGAIISRNWNTGTRSLRSRF